MCQKHPNLPKFSACQIQDCGLSAVGVGITNRFEMLLPLDTQEVSPGMLVVILDGRAGGVVIPGDGDSHRTMGTQQSPHEAGRVCTGAGMFWQHLLHWITK